MSEISWVCAVTSLPVSLLRMVILYSLSVVITLTESKGVGVSKLGFFGVMNEKIAEAWLPLKKIPGSFGMELSGPSVKTEPSDNFVMVTFSFPGANCVESLIIA